jgi:uncharacterized protein YgbK (DUF1537 family)
MLLGCIADDFTGASDLANTLTANGMRTVQTIGVPSGPLPSQGDDRADAVVVALKSRSIAADEAVAQSLAALEWLLAQGAQQILFKYCSTFDSTPAGNIGPVAEALLERLNVPIAIACPVFPTNRRTLYLGHLFVGDLLLSESGMQNHPVTPMTDPNLVRWLQRQMKGKVGLLAHPTVARGPAAIRDGLDALARDGVRIAIADAISDDDLRALGEALAGTRLVTGGSGIALGLPENFRRAGSLVAAATAPVAVGGPAVVLSGSCSIATRRQIGVYREQAPTRLVTADEVVAGGLTPAEVATWALERIAEGGAVPLVYTSADPAEVASSQQRYGAERVSSAIEHFTGELAAQLHARGVRRFIVAGGETSGAVVQALGVARLAIGPEIDPGVPALRGIDVPVGLALKSGNFGADNFFEKALARVG